MSREHPSSELQCPPPKPDPVILGHKLSTVFGFLVEKYLLLFMYHFSLTSLPELQFSVMSSWLRWPPQLSITPCCFRHLLFKPLCGRSSMSLSQASSPNIIHTALFPVPVRFILWLFIIFNSMACMHWSWFIFLWYDKILRHEQGRKCVVGHRPRAWPWSWEDGTTPYSTSTGGRKLQRQCLGNFVPSMKCCWFLSGGGEKPIQAWKWKLYLLCAQGVGQFRKMYCLFKR